MKITWIPAQEQDTACMTALRKEIRATARKSGQPHTVEFIRAKQLSILIFPRTKSGTWRRFGIIVTRSF